MAVLDVDFLQQKKAAPEDSPLRNDVVGQSHVENYALKVFLYADNEDRAGRFNKYKTRKNSDSFNVWKYLPYNVYDIYIQADAVNS